MLAARAGLLALAAAACAWFVLGIVQVNALTQARALLAPGTPSAPADSARVVRLLDRAGTLNPDRDVEVLRAQADVRAGDNAAAQRLIERVVREEPKNINAWIVLAIAAYHRDPATSRLALRREADLAPPVRPAS